MIREDTHGRFSVADTTVTRVEPARIATDAARWGQQAPRRDVPQRRPRRHGNLPPAIAAALPDVDAEACEVLYETDGEGALLGVIVRDAATHQVLATFDVAQLAHLVAATGQRGVLFESRG